MRKSWLMCVLLGTIAWGQAQPGTPPPARPSQAPATSGPQAPAAMPDTSESVAQDAAVLTIKGVCKPQPKPAAAKAGAIPAKAPAAATKPTECKTVITRAEFEKLAASLSPRMTPQLKKQLASVYPNMLAMAQAAQKQGLDKGPQFEAQMRFARLQILNKALRDKISEDAAKISDADVQEYYQQNLASYQQFNLDRVFVPRFRRPETEVKAEEKEDDDKDEKLTPEQQKAKAEAKAEQDKAKSSQSEADEAKLAEALHTRAAAGEDFAKLQKEAYDAAGMKMDAPNVNLPKVRRNALPPSQVAVFELKEGEVSQVITDTGGHYIYRVKAIEQMPLDDTLKNEIHGMLQGQRQRTGMEKYQNSYSVVTNEEYFGPPTPPGTRPGAPPMRMPPNRAPMPGAQPQAQPQTPPPAQPPAAKPN
jgi:PPIC-type PPIASE domain